MSKRITKAIKETMDDIKMPYFQVSSIKDNGDILDVYLDTNKEGRRILMERGLNSILEKHCDDNVDKLSWWQRFKYAWRHAK